MVFNLYICELICNLYRRVYVCTLYKQTITKDARQIGLVARKAQLINRRPISVKTTNLVFIQILEQFTNIISDSQQIYFILFNISICALIKFVKNYYRKYLKCKSYLR